MRKLCAFFAILCLASAARAATVWIDTDASIGSPIREVDDAFALVLALHSPEIQIAGLSTTYGNASLAHTTRATLDLVRRFGAPHGVGPSNVFAGAASSRDLGRRTSASDALAATLLKQKVTYVGLGPLTNLATFLQLHPDMADRIERVIFLGGQTRDAGLALGPNRSFHIHDANVFKDPTAASVVLQSKIPLILVPIETASGLLVDAADLRELGSSSRAGAYLARRSRIWLWFWTHVVKTNGGPIFDALAVIPATRPELLSIKRWSARMDGTGNMVVTPRLTKGARPVRYCTGFAPATKRFVIQRLKQSR